MEPSAAFGSWGHRALLPPTVEHPALECPWEGSAPPSAELAPGWGVVRAPTLISQHCPASTAAHRASRECPACSLQHPRSAQGCPGQSLSSTGWCRDSLSQICAPCVVLEGLVWPGTLAVLLSLPDTAAGAAGGLRHLLQPLGDGLATTWDLPQPALPMTKTECLTCSSSSSCTTFSTKLSSACSFSSSMACLTTWEGGQALTSSSCHSLGKTPETSQLPPEVPNGP